MLAFILKWFFALIVVLFMVGAAISYILEHSPQQSIFLKGTLPNPSLDGFYKGKVWLKPANALWLGKKFDASSQKGVNEFGAVGETMNERFPFKTYPGKGIRDRNLNVLKIDYNIPGNSFWIRPILDEIVQVDADHYLGKLQLRFIPGYSFTLIYFELWQPK